MGSCILGSWGREEGQIWREQQLSEKNKKNCFLASLFHTPLEAHTSDTQNCAGEKVLCRQREEDFLLTLAKGIWNECVGGSLSSNLDTREILFAFIIPFPLPPHIFTLKSVQIFQASRTWFTITLYSFKHCTIHKRIAMKLINGQINWNLYCIRCLSQRFWQKKKKNCTNANS